MSAGLQLTLMNASDVRLQALKSTGGMLGTRRRDKNNDKKKIKASRTLQKYFGKKIKNPISVTQNIIKAQLGVSLCFVQVLFFAVVVCFFFYFIKAINKKKKEKEKSYYYQNIDLNRKAKTRQEKLRILFVLQMSQLKHVQHPGNAFTAAKN